MDRLTFQSDGYYVVDKDSCFDDQNEDYCGPAIDRLAEYENIGLDPIDMTVLKSNVDAIWDMYKSAERELENLRAFTYWIPVSNKPGVYAGMKCAKCGAKITYRESNSGNHLFCHKCGRRVEKNDRP